MNVISYVYCATEKTVQISKGAYKMNSFRFIWQYIRRYRFRYTAGIITLFFVDFFNIFIPKVTGSITDGLTASSLTMAGIRRHLLALCLLAGSWPLSLALLSLWRLPEH